MIENGNPTMSLLKRVSTFTIAALMVVFMAACSGGDKPPEPTPQPQGSGSKISNPKDALSVELCSLLPPEGASAVGLDPAGEIDDGPKLSDDAAETCLWKSPDGHDSLRFSVLTDRSIKDYHDNKSQYSDYQELTIGGYPAVRANKADPAQSGSCSIFLAVADRQVVHAYAAQASITDPCAISQKALESSVPTLPAAK
ncbi:hypothetical protein GCM10009854_37820 [Saccharopolyspora halophila]|uniref:DUF3558 domain-containing protein n=1 Tax=Saccharopolyspora halophila TaxID=405551 RepID=A0ABP5TLN5_9PSEU